MILRAERDKKTAELERLVDAVREIKATIRDIDAALETLSGRIEKHQTSPNAIAERRPLKFLIEDILKAIPGLSPRAISEKLADLGRPTDVNTVLGTLSRAKRDGLVLKRGRVWYVAIDQDTALTRLKESGNDKGATERSPPDELHDPRVE
jgi:hypothetical protein